VRGGIGVNRKGRRWEVDGEGRLQERDKEVG
jgi:hypothetical protein